MTSSGMTRLNKDDVLKSVINLTTHKQVNNPTPSSSALPNSPNSKIVYFTYIGKQDYLGTKFGEECEEGYPLLENETSVAYAKSDYTQNMPHHYVKVDGFGFLFDPQGMVSGSIGRRETMKWIAVSDEAFLHYIQFLKTRNRHHLRAAEKERAE